MVLTYSFPLRIFDQNGVDSATGLSLRHEPNDRLAGLSTPVRGGSNRPAPNRDSNHSENTAGRFVLDRYFGDDANPLVRRWCGHQDSPEARKRNNKETNQGSLIDERHVWPLVLHGRSGVAKTRLAETLLCRMADRGANVLKIAGSDFRHSFLQAISTRSSEFFRQRLDQHHAILLDDIESAGVDATVQRELIQLLDRFHRLQRPVLVTMRTSPLGDHPFGPQLVSRLSRGLVVAVRPPGRNARQDIIEHLARKLDLVLDGDALLWLVDNLPGLPALMRRDLSRVALQSNQDSISLDHVTRILGSSGSAHEHTCLRKISGESAKYFGLSSQQLRGGSRRQLVVRARSVAVYLAKRQLGISYNQIGLYFGRDQSTVRHAYMRIQKLIDTDPKIAAAVRLVAEKVDVDELHSKGNHENKRKHEDAVPGKPVS